MISSMLTFLPILTLILVFFILVQIRTTKSTSGVKQIQQLVSNEFRENRKELSGMLKDNREELSLGIEKLTEKLNEKFTALGETLKVNAKDDREAVSDTHLTLPTIE